MLGETRLGAVVRARRGKARLVFSKWFARPLLRAERIALKRAFEERFFWGPRPTSPAGAAYWGFVPRAGRLMILQGVLGYA